MPLANAEIVDGISDDVLLYTATTNTGHEFELVVFRVSMRGHEWARIDLKLAQIGSQPTTEALQILYDVMRRAEDNVVGGFVVVAPWLVLRHTEHLDHYAVDRAEGIEVLNSFFAAVGLLTSAGAGALGIDTG